MRLLGECRGSIDVVKEAEGELTADKDDVPGLTNPTVMDAQGKGQLVTHTSHLLSRQTVSCHQYSVGSVELSYLFSSRCDRALGADPGPGSE